MWTAQIQQIIKEGEPQIAILFTNNTDSKVIEYFKLRGQTADSLKNQIENRRKFYDDSDAFIATVDNTFSLTPTATPPTQTDIDTNAFTKDWTRLQRVNVAISNGLLTGNETSVINFKAKVKSEFATLVSDVGADAALSLL